jgi:leucyl-tRNA synthetase
MILAPEHPLVSIITTPDRRAEVDEYVRKAQQATEIERMNTERTKTGVFTGAYALNPVNEEPVPVWIADYVLTGYGTGAIMAVPAHDQRDFEFAHKFGLPIRLVYRAADGPMSAEEMTQALPEGGTVINSGRFDGLPNSKETIAKFVAWLEQTGKGKAQVNYKLRDWLISRQRYWGAPIPIVHCSACGEVPVPEEQLPILLPDVESYQPSGTGESPLTTIEEFVNTFCPRCGGAARRETDTMGGFACSSWYFLRFADSHNAEEFASRAKLDSWLPVDLYTGGTEHAVMHLLYARFWTKVMHDAGLVGFAEPFRHLRNQGTMLAYTPGRRPRPDEVVADEDDDQIIDWIVLKPEERATFPEDQIIWRWAKMSKSKGNGIQPDELIDQYGADTLRLYVMFVAPFEDDVQWTEEGLKGALRFVNRLWRWLTTAVSAYDPYWQDKLAAGQVASEDRDIRRKLHQTVRKVEYDLENFRFNTAIAALMELVNDLYTYRHPDASTCSVVNAAVVSEVIDKLVLLVAPFAPHLAEEVWTRVGHDGFACHAVWPSFNPAVAAEEEITVVVQVNGKLRARLTVPAGTDKNSLEELAFASSRVRESLDGKQIRRVVVVKDKLINIVAN